MWSLTRRAQIIDWAKKSGDPDVRAAGERVSQAGARGRSANATTRESNTLHLISREIAAERIVFYRRVLAAWEFFPATI